MRTKDIYERTASLEGGSVVFAIDFLDLCTERQAGRVLTELGAKGEIKRLACPLDLGSSCLLTTN